MENGHVKDRLEYLALLKDTFSQISRMPEQMVIQDFMEKHNLYDDLGMWDSDVKRDIKFYVLDYKYKQIKKTSANTISSYKGYLEKLKEHFDIPLIMPGKDDIQGFIDYYKLEKNYDIDIKDVTEDLKRIIDGDFYEMYQEAVKDAPKPWVLPAYVTKTVFQTSRSSTESNIGKTVILVDGDNHIKEGLDGIDNKPTDLEVKAYFSQAGAKEKFDKTHFGRGISAEIVESGNQAVDKRIMFEANTLLTDKRVNVVIISQDKDFVGYGKRKNDEVGEKRVQVHKSIREYLGAAWRCE